MRIPRPKSKQILRKKQSHIIAYYIYFFDSDYIGSSWFLKMVYIIRIYKKVIFISHLRRRPLFAPNFSFRRSSSSYYYSVLNIFILRERKSLVFDSMVSCKPQNGFVTTIAPTLLVVNCATGLVDENFGFEMLWLLFKMIIMPWLFIVKWEGKRKLSWQQLLFLIQLQK